MKCLNFFFAITFLPFQLNVTVSFDKKRFKVAFIARGPYMVKFILGSESRPLLGIRTLQAASPSRTAICEVSGVLVILLRS